MDRTSRFQNPIPLCNGNTFINSNKPVQSDAGKPPPPPILDRFRALVKEREDDLRVFGGGGGAYLPLETDDIVRIYEVVLSELTINSKPIITDLTIIAGEQRAHGEGIADAICARIIEVPVGQKLPFLYLLDSIVKNIGKEYIKYFSVRLPEVFCEAYAQVHPNMHPAMRHLFGTWSSVFPLAVLQKIEARLQFVASINGQSSVLSSSRASESPRPPHGIHINPKYLEAQNPFGHSTVDVVGTESLSSSACATSGFDAVKKPLSSASRITRSSSPYRIGRAGSPSLEDFGVDNSPKRVSVKASPSHSGIEHGLSKVVGRDEETSEWRARNWQGNSNQLLKTSAMYNTGVDLRGPRALISAYGMDEREKNLNHMHHTAEPLVSNGADQVVATRSWQNTEEEEFDWDDVAPASTDRKQSSERYPAIHGNSTARHNFTTNHSASLPGSRSVNKIAGVLPNIVGPNDVRNQIPSSSFAQESLLLPHQQPHSHLNARGANSFSEGRSYFTSGEQKAPVTGKFSRADGKFGGPSNYNPPAPDIQSANAAAFTKSWRPAQPQNSHIMPSLSALPTQLQIRGPFGMQNAANKTVDQGLNRMIQYEHHLGSTRNTSQLGLHQNPSQLPGPVPFNLQNNAQPPLLQPNLLMPQEVRQNLPLPSSVSNPSHSIGPSLNYGYLAQGHGPGTTLSNQLPGVQSSLPMLHVPNISFHVPGTALPSLRQSSLPSTSQSLPISQNIGQVAPNPPGGSDFTGLFNTLMTQGIISLAKQDSVGVEFDQDSLKVRHESAIMALYADLPRQCTSCGVRFKSQEDHSKHMDWHVSKNRTLKNRRAKPSPKWFVSVNMWLSGAEALGIESVPGFMPAESTVEKVAEEEELAVPADEEQNACALCGEPFDDFYSDEMEEWMYKGAVYMYAAPGSTVGLDRSQLGPIVHAKCRSGSDVVPSEDLKNNKWESAEEGNQRKRLRS